MSQFVPSAVFDALPLTRFEVRGPQRVPDHRSYDTASPFLRGVQEGLFPRFDDTMGRSDSRPSISPRFVVFARRYHPLRRICSQRSRRTIVGIGELSDPGSRAGIRGGNGRASQVPGEPLWSLSVLSDPGRTDHALWVQVKRDQRGPRSCPQRRLPASDIFGAQSHGL